MDNIFQYVSKENYEKMCKTLADGDLKNIYNSNGIEIDLKKIGKKIYKFISIYGQDDINRCIENMYERRNH